MKPRKNREAARHRIAGVEPCFGRRSSIPLALLAILMMHADAIAIAEEGYPEDGPRGRVRDFGIEIGVLPTGEHNAITDVAGVRVGQVTLVEGDAVRTGVTVVVPHDGNLFQEKVPAAIHVANGFGKLAGITQVRELGNLETPVVLTNTLSVAAGIEALVTHALGQEGNESVRSVNAVVGETNDGRLNDIRGRHVKPEHVLEALRLAEGGPVEEGNVGAGTGTSSFGFKAGIGTSSRVLPDRLGGYTIGVLAQSNYGGVLQIDGLRVGEALGRHSFRESLDRPEGAPDGSPDGSCMIVVATDAPLEARNLERLAMRAMLGLAKTGGIASNGSGDYVIAFSTAEGLRIPHRSRERTQRQEVLRNDETSPLFLAAIEATEEALLNALFQARSMTGRDGQRIEALPVGRVLELRRGAAGDDGAP